MKPVLQALVLAERIYNDQSGKKIICGTFNTIMTGQVPVPQQESAGGTKTFLIPGGTDPGCPAVFASLTDVVDGTQVVLEFVNLTKNEVVFQTEFTLHVADRLATVEIIAPLPPMAFLGREPGTYSLDLLWGTEILGSHRILVRTMGQA